MQCFIIIGQPEEFEEYLDRFINSHNIKRFNTIRYAESIKLEDVKKTISLVRLKLGADEKRLVVMSGRITLAAQNAMLKLLEELSEDTFVIFSVSDLYILLPTIISRCSVVRLESKVVASNDLSLESNHSSLSAFLTALSSHTHTKEEYIQRLLELREICISTQDRNLFRLLKDLHAGYSFVTNNNVQVTGFLDTIL